jgi:hypothetical protein
MYSLRPLKYTDFVTLTSFLLLFVSTGVWTQGLGLLLYHRSHASNPFAFSYFSDRVFYFCLGPAWSLILLPMPLPRWDYWCVPPPVFLLRWILANIFRRLASNCDPPSLRLLSIWDYRSVPVCPPVNFYVEYENWLPMMIHSLTFVSRIILCLL